LGLPRRRRRRRLRIARSNRQPSRSC
jgi:hypothetical protein